MLQQQQTQTALLGAANNGKFDFFGTAKSVSPNKPWLKDWHQTDTPQAKEPFFKLIGQAIHQQRHPVPSNSKSLGAITTKKSEPNTSPYAHEAGEKPVSSKDLQETTQPDLTSDVQDSGNVWSFKLKSSTDEQGQLTLDANGAVLDVNIQWTGELDNLSAQITQIMTQLTELKPQLPESIQKQLGGLIANLDEFNTTLDQLQLPQTSNEFTLLMSVNTFPIDALRHTEPTPFSQSLEKLLELSKTMENQVKALSTSDTTLPDEVKQVLQEILDKLEVQITSSTLPSPKGLLATQDNPQSETVEIGEAPQWLKGLQQIQLEWQWQRTSRQASVQDLAPANKPEFFVTQSFRLSINQSDLPKTLSDSPFDTKGWLSDVKPLEPTQFSDLLGIQTPPPNDTLLLNTDVSIGLSNSVGQEGALFFHATSIQQLGLSSLLNTHPHPNLHGILNQMAHAPVETQVVDSAKLMIQNGRKEMTIQLMPEDLGKVRIQLVSNTAREVTATLVTETKDSQQQLEKHVQDLQRSLEAQGVRLSRVTVVHAGQESFNTQNQQYQDPAKSGSDHQETANNSSSNGFGFSSGQNTEQQASGSETGQSLYFNGTNPVTPSFDEAVSVEINQSPTLEKNSSGVDIKI